MQFTTRPEIKGTFGVVASTHWLGTAVGMATLEKGGNAFDAGAACGFALQAVEPHLCGPLGDAPILIYSARDRAAKVVCGQGPAPAAATIAAHKALGIDLIPGMGMLAAVIPGAFDAWMLMLRDYGTMSVAEILAPAIEFAGNGYPVVPNITGTIGKVQRLFTEHWHTSAAVYLPNGAPPQPGTLFSNPKLAETYKRVVREAEAAGGDRIAQIDAARRAWREGFVAEAIDRFVRHTPVMDVTGRANKGLLTGDDMARWRATIEDPLTYDYNGYTVCKTQPWGQGPVFLQSLALLKGFDVAGMDPNGAEFVHTVTECSKLAYADREAFYGDPDFVDVPTDVLLSDAYNDQRRKLIGDNASFDLRPGSVPGYGGKPIEIPPGTMKGDLSAFGIGEPTVATFDERERPTPDLTRDPVHAGDTVHIDVIDRHGNMVSATPSGGWLQSSPVIPDLGFCLGSRAQMFWLEEGLPASLAPGKRPRTTLSPSMALRDGEGYMAFGTPGGDGQDQWTLHLFLRHVQHGMNLQEAIDSPEFHTAHFPSSFFPRESNPGHLKVEGRFSQATKDDLKSRGHKMEVDADWSIGRFTAAAKDGRMLKAAANPRGMQGYAIGR